MSIFETIKEAIGFDQVAADYGIEFDRAKKAICPFHIERTGSFHSYGTHGYCFSCQKSADMIELEAFFKSLSSFDAALSLAKRYNVRLPEFSKEDREKFDKQQLAYELLEQFSSYANKEIKENAEALAFLKGKGLDEADISQYRIGYVSDNSHIMSVFSKQAELALAKEIGLAKERFENRIIIPIWNNGKMTFLTARTFPDRDPKYLHLKNSELLHKSLVFCENLRKEFCVITEGVFDALALLKANIPACALLGTNPGKDARNKLLKAKARLYFCMDADNAGTQASYKLSREFKGYSIALDDSRDVDEILAEVGAEEFRKLAQSAISGSTYYLDAVIENEDRKEALAEIAKLEMQSDQDVWLKRLHEKYKSTGVTLESLRKDLRRFSKAASQTEAVTNDKDVGRVTYTADFPGLVDITVDDKGQTIFLIKEGNSLEIRDSVIIDDKTLYPPERGQLPFKLFPRADEVQKHYVSDNDNALFYDVVKYFRQVSELPNESLYLLMAAWALHTYLMENFGYSPYPWLHAIPERGKSRTGKGAIYIAYRGIHVESLRDAYLIRIANDLKASIFFDAMDLWRKAEKVGSEDILLQRFERGACVARVLYPDRGAHKDTVFYHVFGPTLIATNESVHPALESRTILITMRETSRQFGDIPLDIAQTLKERLVAFRGRHLTEQLPQIQKPAHGRLGDILKPLMQMVLLAAPEKEKEFRTLISELNSERKAQKSDSSDAKLIEIVAALENQAVDGLLAIQSVQDRYNEGTPERFQTKSQSLGRRLNALGFEKRRRGKGQNIVYDAELVQNLLVKFGLAEEDNETKDFSSENGEKYQHYQHYQHSTNKDGAKNDVDNDADIEDNEISTLNQHHGNPYRQRSNADNVDNVDNSHGMTGDAEEDPINQEKNTSRITKVNHPLYDLTFRVEQIGADGKPTISIVTPICPNFSEVLDAYEKQRAG